MWTVRVEMLDGKNVRKLVWAFPTKKRAKAFLCEVLRKTTVIYVKMEKKDELPQPSKKDRCED
jgi:hypothetical protein